MDKVKNISNYWETPHTTYDDNSLQKKCSCPPPPCEIVDGILGNISSKGYVEGCKTKYMTTSSGIGWECNNSVEKGNQGACIPPRRRKLYVYDLKTLSGEVTQVQLREAFIKCAAIETFFAWHKFKKIKEKEDKEQHTEELMYISPEPDKLNKDLKKGEVPEEFKRQLFYTFGDYRDILFGKDMSKGMGELNDKINKVFANGGGKIPSGRKITPKEWWEQNAKDIWEGMLCALSYNTETKEMDKDVRTQLIENSKNKYLEVTFIGGFNSDKTSTINNTTTKLTDFVKRPPYFRWLEEWADEFCRKKKIKIDKIKVDCSGQYDNKSSSGDGEDCDKIIDQDYNIVPSLENASCAISCKSYKEWINTKKDEFEKQKCKYENKIQKLENYSDKIYDENFVKELPEKYASINLFLGMLKGPCSNNNTEDYKIDFNKTKDTFGPAKRCAACPLSRVKCKNVDFKGSTVEKCSGKTFITTKDIKAKKNPIDIDMLVIDKNTKDFAGNLDICKNTDIFEGIKNDQWSCGYVCDIDICAQENKKDNIDDEENILIRALFKRWIENFLKDYNKINDKISQCMNNGKEPICINGFENKYKCVDKWISMKKEEWKNVRTRYFNQYNVVDKRKVYEVKGFLEQGMFKDDVDKAIKPSENVDNLQDSNECIDPHGSENAEGRKKDVVVCLLDRLQDKIKTCQTNHKHSVKNQTSCENPTLDDDTYPDPDDEEEQPTEQPKFCPKDVEGTKGPETDSDKLCNDKQEAKCDDFKKIYNNSTCEPKVKLIGLGAHYHRPAPYYPNIYISPRVQQLCLGPLKELAKLKKDKTHESELIEALKKCAYNEGKGLYEYYKNNKDTIGKNGSTLTDEEVKPYTLEAMKRSYADYGNIVKGDTWWIYSYRRHIDTVIISVAEIFNGNSKSSHVSIDDDTKRLQLWESIRNDVWKAMICGYKSAGGSMKNLPSGGEFCTLPSNDNENQFSRWFKEWGESFCIRRELKLKRLKEKCEKGICNDRDEAKKQECLTLCKDYKAFIKNYENQYKKQSIQYKELESSINEFKDKNPFMFLQENCNSEFPCFKGMDENELNKIFHYPSDEIIKFCTCTSKDTSKTTPTNCIEKAAYELQKEATNKIGNNSKNLKGKEIALSDCRRGDYVVVDNSVGKKIDKDKVEIEFPSNTYSCEHKEINSFHVGKEWDCNYRNINDRDKNLCLPPRRQFMCMKKLEDISAKVVEDKENLLRIVMEVGKEEGIRILRNYQEQNKTDFSEICDDMKYSFADLGDIIRGRDLWKEYPNYHTTERNLQDIFRKIHYNITKGGAKDKYKYDRQYFHKLRNDWWNTNREAIWKAMTCCAPRSAYIYKKTNTGENIRSTDMYYYCGYTKEPPYDDYIPQRLRWMKEWGEYVCKKLNEKINDIKNECDKCKLNDPNCSNQDDGNNCTNCKEKCREYNKLIHNLKSQLDIQKEIYKELYKKIKDNGIRFTTDNDKEVIEFLKKVEEKKGCDMKSLDEYLDKASHCINYKFNEKEKDKETYAFNLNRNVYKEKCTCGITNDILDKCPDKNTCTKYDSIHCFRKEHDDNAYWESTFVNNDKTTIKKVLVPPRRKSLCLRIHPNNIVHLRKEIKNFKNFICSSAFSEAKRLKHLYKDDSKLLQAMKYSFSDIGNVVKGDDMMKSPTSKYIEQIFKGTEYSGIYRKTWWEQNKNDIWESMLCGYTEAGGELSNNEKCRFPDIESVPQFLRWFQEWTENFCTRRKELYEEVQNICASAKCNTSNGSVDKKVCTEACEKYKNYILSKEKEYEIQKDKYYAEFKDKYGNEKDAPDYFKDKCKNNCECLSKHTDNGKNWKEPYETLDDSELIGKCKCKKVKPKTPDVIPAGATETKEKDTPHAPEKPQQPPQPLPPSDEPFDPTILQTTIPFGIALALGSIAFLFIKKKPKSPVDLIRVLNIPKGDYGTPTPKSKNRYIPYRSGPYKGKTYIYMEGDTSGDEDKYIWDLSSSDITSSESEYEEMDINDIYVPGSPKYKTLIEVVLEPSKSNGNTPSKGDGNTLGDDMVPTTNTFTDEEWNELKHDFISQYIQSEPLDVPQYDVSRELPMNTQRNILDDGMEEKPFITSIHDRDLNSGEEISYNINMSTNSMDDRQYVSNNVYSGIDLINDTLSGNKHIDIYDEVLKRKENELFGTNYKKNTSNNNVAKLTNSDPIMNQLDLLHKWLDRHRDMCEKWNKKEELLDKLKEEWNKEKDGGNVPSDNKRLNTDVSIEIDMDDGKPKKEFSNMDTILDDMEDDIYYDVNDDENPFVDDIPMDHNKVDVPKKVHVEMKILNNTSNGSLEPEFPISDINDQRNHKNTTHHTQTTRSLCECELYELANYDNDPQMKEVMQQFEYRTSQRFHEYDDRMKTTRQKCKDKCDKEIQKIILKDKLEKQMEQQLTTLDPNITTEDIPTCICEKSLADKTEKFCLNCGKTMGGVAPGWGLISGIVYTGWKTAALAAAKELAEKAGAAEGASKGAAAGLAKFIAGMKSELGLPTLFGKEWGSIFNASNYTNETFISESILSEFSRSGCRNINSLSFSKPICISVNERIIAPSRVTGGSPEDFIKTTVQSMVSKAKDVAEAKAAQVTSETTATLTAQKTSVVESTYMGYQGAIIASIVAIVVIVLILVIIYLILRYRRKKKMKKKLQYIKLLEE
ncbi:hypothetical protein PFMALIP_05753 [Plasmodium falciparum MaliPS096_E11]|uniref:Erythrocyte membrane protein 1 n=1 Tax=Plasmodium falciparum MaliPS096_E11 TaxID=1036727 RepID=A0A024WI21_PLAFA|nr:hypothetical protein PFMALIP_05753 [Plasmodium falciparum MaliPS096_E11]